MDQEQLEAELLNSDGHEFEDIQQAENENIAREVAHNFFHHQGINADSDDVRKVVSRIRSL